VPGQFDAPLPIARAAWHSLLWLVFANSIGVPDTTDGAVGEIARDWMGGEIVYAAIATALFG